jgi:MoaA/NifB/PqqE/SkfB family radical SAM enzyme
MGLVRKVPKNILNGLKFRYNYIFNKGIYPTFIIYKITMNCNSRCRTCSIWKTKSKNELNLEQIKKIFKKNFWKNLKYVQLTGGEPFLRRDYPDIVNIFTNFKKIEVISTPTNGFLTKKIISDVSKVLEYLQGKKLYSVTVSLDGLEKEHNHIRRIPNGYKKATETIRRLKELERSYEKFTVGIETVISKYNIKHLDKIYNEFRKLTDHLNFTPAIEAPYFLNIEEDFGINKKDYNIVIRFYRKIEKDNPSLAYYYENIINFFEKGIRTYPCLGMYNTICLGAKGEIHPCVMLNKKLGNALEDNIEEVWFSKKANKYRESLKRNKFCRTCLNSCDMLNNYNEEFLHFFWFLIKNPRLAYMLYKKTRDGYLKYYI